MFHQDVQIHTLYAHCLLTSFLAKPSELMDSRMFPSPFDCQSVGMSMAHLVLCSFPATVYVSPLGVPKDFRDTHG